MLAESGVLQGATARGGRAFRRNWAMRCPTSRGGGPDAGRIPAIRDRSVARGMPVARHRQKAGSAGCPPRSRGRRAPGRHAGRGGRQGRKGMAAEKPAAKGGRRRARARRRLLRRDGAAAEERLERRTEVSRGGRAAEGSRPRLRVRWMACWGRLQKGSAPRKRCRVRRERPEVQEGVRGLFGHQPSAQVSARSEAMRPIASASPCVRLSRDRALRL